VIPYSHLNVARARQQPGCSQRVRHFVLHADDFGMNDAVTEGILAGFTEGLLTSTSIITNSPGSTRALNHWKDLQARYAVRDLPSLEARLRLYDSPAPFDLGIHLNLTQGRPLTGDKYPAELLDERGLFPGIGPLARRLLIGGWKFRDFLEQEFKAQIEFLLDHGISPSHLNAHQYVDTFPVVASLTPALLHRYGIRVVRVPWERGVTRSTLIHRFEPLNWCLGQVKGLFAWQHGLEMERRGVLHPSGYFGASHAGRIDLPTMEIFVSLARSGLSEIGMHPGGLPVPGTAPCSGDGWDDPLATLRPRELALLTSPDLALLLETHRIRLSRLADLVERQDVNVAA
jgi:predicted glycoside hydrolase/deacetylase ChbG (UPF0249 family)